MILLTIILNFAVSAQLLCPGVDKAKGQSTTEEQISMLKDVKSSMLREARLGMESMKEAAECFGSSRVESDYCSVMRAVVGQTLERDLRRRELADTLQKSGTGSRQRRSQLEVLDQARLTRGVPIKHILGSELPAEDLIPQLKIVWTHRLFETLQKRIKSAKEYESLDEQCRYFERGLTPRNFRQVNLSFKEDLERLRIRNPMLEGYPLNKGVDGEEIKKSFLRLADSGQAAIEMIKQLKVDHSNIGDYEIWARDHEMGLVNFHGQFAQQVAKKAGEERKRACIVWRDLQNQRDDKVNGSIYVGAGTNLVCAGGLVVAGVVAFLFPPSTLLSGTLIAGGGLVSCSLSAADGVNGAINGIKDYQISDVARLAGLKAGGRPQGQALMDPEVAERRKYASAFVAAINGVAIVGLGASVRSALLPAKAVVVSSISRTSAASTAKVVANEAGSTAAELNQDIFSEAMSDDVPINSEFHFGRISSRYPDVYEFYRQCRPEQEESEEHVQ